MAKTTKYRNIGTHALEIGDYIVPPGTTVKLTKAEVDAYCTTAAGKAIFDERMIPADKTMVKSDGDTPKLEAENKKLKDEIKKLKDEIAELKKDPEPEPEGKDK